MILPGVVIVIIESCYSISLICVPGQVTRERRLLFSIKNMNDVIIVVSLRSRNN